MALIRCLECGRDVSTKAQSCPGCGAPVEHKVIGDSSFVPEIERSQNLEPVRHSAHSQMKSGYGVRKLLLTIIGVLLIGLGTLLVVGTVLSMPIVPVGLSLMRMVLAGLLIFGGISAWKAGRRTGRSDTAQHSVLTDRENCG